MQCKMYAPKKEWKPRTLAITFESEKDLEIFKMIVAVSNDMYSRSTDCGRMKQMITNTLERGQF